MRVFSFGGSVYNFIMMNIPGSVVAHILTCRLFVGMCRLRDDCCSICSALSLADLRDFMTNYTLVILFIRWLCFVYGVTAS